MLGLSKGKVLFTSGTSFERNFFLYHNFWLNCCSQAVLYVYLNNSTWLLQEDPGRYHCENWFGGYDHFLVTWTDLKFEFEIIFHCIQRKSLVNLSQAYHLAFCRLSDYSLWVQCCLHFGI